MTLYRRIQQIPINSRPTIKNTVWLSVAIWPPKVLANHYKLKMNLSFASIKKYPKNILAKHKKNNQIFDKKWVLPNRFNEKLLFISGFNKYWSTPDPPLKVQFGQMGQDDPQKDLQIIINWKWIGHLWVETNIQK